MRPDDVPAGPILLGIVAEQLPSPARHQALHPRGESIGHRDIDRGDRLQQERLAFWQGLLDRLTAGGLERHVRAVDRVKLAGDQFDREIDDRKAERPMLQRLDDALLDRRDVVARDRTADDLVGKDKAGAARHRLDLYRAVGELAVTAALPFEAGMLLGAAADGFLVGYRRRLADDREVVAVLQPVDR